MELATRSDSLYIDGAFVYFSDLTPGASLGLSRRLLGTRLRTTLRTRLSASLSGLPTRRALADDLQADWLGTIRPQRPEGGRHLVLKHRPALVQQRHRFDRRTNSLIQILFQPQNRKMKLS